MLLVAADQRVQPSFSTALQAASVPRLGGGPPGADARPYDQPVTQCLVIAPNHADLSVLRTVLGELGAEVTTTTDLSMVNDLTFQALSRFDYAVALLPAEEPDAAIYFQLGFFLGHGWPLFVIAEQSDEAIWSVAGRGPDLAGGYEEETLRLHLGLFAKVAPLKTGVATRTPVDMAPSSWREKIAVAAVQGFALEEEVLERLRASGSLVVERDGPRDLGADAVIMIPGFEQTLGDVLIEVKASQDHRTLREAARRLASVVAERRASMGLLVYSAALTPQTGQKLAADVADLPILLMHIDDFRHSTGADTLGRKLIKAHAELASGRHSGP